MVVRSVVEQQLHAQIASGDVAAAAEQLVLLYGSEVLGRCRTLVRDRAVAEDLAQDVFCRAFSGLAAFRGEASLRTWLFAIVRNVCIDHHRRAAGAAWMHDETADTEEQPEERPFLIQLMVDREQLERALAGLDERERVLVVLRFVHGMEHAELAACFGLREGTIRMRLCRALARMRDTLAPREVSRGVRGPVHRSRGFPGIGQSGRTESDRSSPPPMFESPPSAASGESERWNPSRLESSAKEHVRGEAVERLESGDALFVMEMMETGDERTGRDALPPLARALGLLLEGAESRPSVGALLRSLRPTLAGLAGAGSQPARASRPGSWLGRLFGSGPRS